MHALAQTGGLPEFDAFNEIIIYRDRFHDRKERTKVLQEFEFLPQQEISSRLGETIRIPLRLPPGMPMPFRAQDILLQTGDVIFLEARDEQVFFTAGLLPPGKHV